MLAAVVDATLSHPFWTFDWDLVLSPHVVVCSIVLFLSGVLCSAAGIGGGGVYVAVLMVIGLLSPHDAVPLSKAVVFFGAMATLALNARRIQGSKGSQKSVIDFHAVRVTVPAALIGTFLGVAMNFHTSGGTIVVILAALLTFLTVTTGHKAWEQYRDEQRSQDLNAVVMANMNAGDADEAGEDAPLIPKVKEMTMVKHRADEENVFTTRDVALTSTLLGSVVVSGVLRYHMRACEAEVLSGGTQGACSHPVMLFFGDQMRVWMSNPESAWFMQNGMMASVLLFCVFSAAFYGSYTYQVAGWTAKDITTYQTMGVVTGLLAGLVGVGGGLIFSPFFLVMGMDPAVAVATSSTCVLFTSSSTTLQYILTDRVIMSLALAYGVVTLGASLVGTSLVHFLQDHCNGRRSYISCIVAVAVALSAVLALVKFFRMVAVGL